MPNILKTVKLLERYRNVPLSNDELQSAWSTFRSVLRNRPGESFALEVIQRAQADQSKITTINLSLDTYPDRERLAKRLRAYRAWLYWWESEGHGNIQQLALEQQQQEQTEDDSDKELILHVMAAMVQAAMEAQDSGNPESAKPILEKLSTLIENPPENMNGIYQMAWVVDPNYVPKKKNASSLKVVDPQKGYVLYGRRAQAALDAQKKGELAGDTRQTAGAVKGTDELTKEHLKSFQHGLMFMNKDELRKLHTDLGIERPGRKRLKKEFVDSLLNWAKGKAETQGNTPPIEAEVPPEESPPLETPPEQPAPTAPPEQPAPEQTQPPEQPQAEQPPQETPGQPAAEAPPPKPPSAHEMSEEEFEKQFFAAGKNRMRVGDEVLDVSGKTEQQKKVAVRNFHKKLVMKAAEEGAELPRAVKAANPKAEKVADEVIDDITDEEAGQLQGMIGKEIEKPLAKADTRTEADWDKMTDEEQSAELDRLIAEQSADLPPNEELAPKKNVKNLTAKPKKRGKKDLLVPLAESKTPNIIADVDKRLQSTGMGKEHIESVMERLRQSGRNFASVDDALEFAKQAEKKPAAPPTAFDLEPGSGETATKPEVKPAEEPAAPTPDTGEVPIPDRMANKVARKVTTPEDKTFRPVEEAKTESPSERFKQLHGNALNDPDLAAQTLQGMSKQDIDQVVKDAGFFQKFPTKQKAIDALKKQILNRKGINERAKEEDGPNIADSIRSLYDRSSDISIPMDEIKPQLDALDKLKLSELLPIAERMEIHGMKRKKSSDVAQAIKQKILDRRSSAQRVDMIQNPNIHRKVDDIPQEAIEQAMTEFAKPIHDSEGNAELVQKIGSIAFKYKVPFKALWEAAKAA